MKTLVFVHGRSQEHKDAAALKEEWVDSLRSSLEKLGLNFPLSDGQVRFPYYGQTLFDLVNGQPGRAAEVIVKGELGSSEEEEFTREVLSEVIARAGVTDEQIREVAGQDVVEKGPLNWKWVQAGLVALDRFVPGASSATIALATRDVYRYLRNAGVRDVIEEGVRKALPEGEECVVVSHSLGTVVAYNLLRREGQQHSWRVPLLVTLGSPLGVTAIVRSLRPIEHPPVVSNWFNAYDDRDVVALYPLDSERFPVQPMIENYGDVQNTTPNRHGITGYLGDSMVARHIHRAITA
jgi:hypothetical protein